MDGKRKLKKSRDSWKVKAVERGDRVRYLSRENERLAKERDYYRRLAARLDDERERLNVLP